MIRNGHNTQQPDLGKRKLQPQFALSDLLISPFDAHKVYAPDGQWTWQPDERNLQPTGIAVMDQYLRWLSDGSGDTTTFCQRLGIEPAHLSCMVQLLTGFNAQELTQHIHLRVANLLITCTELPTTEILPRCGIASRTTFSRDYQAYFGIQLKKAVRPDHATHRVAAPDTAFAQPPKRRRLTYEEQMAEAKRFLDAFHE